MTGSERSFGARIADCEDELTWEDLFSDLKDRGLRRVDLINPDGHQGIRTAVERSFHGCSWQMYQVHFIRAVLKKIPRKDRKNIVAILKDSLCDLAGFRNAFLNSNLVASLLLRIRSNVSRLI